MMRRMRIRSGMVGKLVIEELNMLVAAHGRFSPCMMLHGR